MNDSHAVLIIADAAMFGRDLVHPCPLASEMQLAEKQSQDETASLSHSNGRRP